MTQPDLQDLPFPSVCVLILRNFELKTCRYLTEDCFFSLIKYCSLLNFPKSCYFLLGFFCVVRPSALRGERSNWQALMRLFGSYCSDFEPFLFQIFKDLLVALCCRTNHHFCDNFHQSQLLRHRLIIHALLTLKREVYLSKYRLNLGIKLTNLFWGSLTRLLICHESSCFKSIHVSVQVFQ